MFLKSVLLHLLPVTNNNWAGKLPSFQSWTCQHQRDAPTSPWKLSPGLAHSRSGEDISVLLPKNKSSPERWKWEGGARENALPSKGCAVTIRTCLSTSPAAECSCAQRSHPLCASAISPPYSRAVFIFIYFIGIKSPYIFWSSGRPWGLEDDLWGHFQLKPFQDSMILFAMCLLHRHGIIPKEERCHPLPTRDAPAPSAACQEAPKPLLFIQC